MNQWEIQENYCILCGELKEDTRSWNAKPASFITKFGTITNTVTVLLCAVRTLGDETLKKIAVEITEKLRNSTTVDWQVRDSIRAKLKILVRITLQRWKYPPDKTPEAIELVGGVFIP